MFIKKAAVEKPENENKIWLTGMSDIDPGNSNAIETDEVIGVLVPVRIEASASLNWSVVFEKNGSLLLLTASPSDK